MIDRLRLSNARRRLGRLLFASVSAVVIGAAVASWTERIHFTVNGAPYDEGESGWISAEPTSALPVRFSDGSTVDLSAGARGRVASVGVRGASLVLETGRVDVHVVHRWLSDWTVAAGPYTVRVTGTELTVAWDPEAEQLDVEVTHGTVAVSGPALAGEQLVSTGQHLRVEDRLEYAALGPIEPHIASVEMTPGDINSSWTTPDEAPPARPSVPRAEPKKEVAPAPRGPTASELLALSDAARGAGRTERAADLLRDLRKRFPRTDEASIAAYTLGVTAFDQARAFDQAATWFETYLRERPTGSLAAEALGRWMECETALGRTERAAAVAKRYLAAYPAGAHADVAAKLLAAP
jgi:TolA-binding protein